MSAISKVRLEKMGVSNMKGEVVECLSSTRLGMDVDMFWIRVTALG